VAEILVKAVDATHPDPVKDAHGCYKRGDIVEIGPNGHYGNYTETARPPVDGGLFCRVQISNVTVEQVEQFVRNRLGPDAYLAMPDTEGTDENGQPIIRFRRRIHINPDWLPASVRNQLRNTGLYVTTWAAVRSYVRDKRDGQGM
jgi:hypothetical protein